MNLLIINDGGIFGGGTENRVRLLIQEAFRRKTFGNMFLLELEGASSDQLDLPVKVFKCKRADSYRKTLQIIKENNIDIVQVHNLLSMSIGPIKAAKSMQKPVIWFAHDYWAFCGRRILLDKKQKPCFRASFLNCTKCIGLIPFFYLKNLQRFLNKCDLAIAPSQYVKGIMEKNGLLKGKWQVIRPWINCSLFSKNNQKKSKYSILFVGPLSEHKGIFLTVKSLGYIKKEIPKIKLKIIGSEQEKLNPLRVKLEKLAAKEGVLSNIQFLGYKNHTELAKEYSKAHVYICPPLWPETFGQTWAQAMACGTAVVATKVGSIPELSGGNIVLVETRAPKKLAQAVMALLSNDKECKKFVIKGQSLTESFQVKKAADQLLRVYNSFL